MSAMVCVRVSRLLAGMAGLLLFAMPASAGVVAISWTDYSVDEEGFTIERRAEHSPTFVTVATQPENTIAYLDRGVPSGAVYCYRVRAFNAMGPSAYTNESCSTAMAEVSPVRVTLDQPSYRTNQTMVATVRVTQDFVTPVDTYVVMQGPGGLMSLQLDGRLVPGLVPIARNVVLPTIDVPFGVPLVGAPPGAYVWMAGVKSPGTLSIVSPIANTPFTVTP